MISNRYKNLKPEVEAVLVSGSSLPLVYVRSYDFVSGNRRAIVYKEFLWLFSTFFEHQLLPIGDEM